MLPRKYVFFRHVLGLDLHTGASFQAERDLILMMETFFST